MRAPFGNYPATIGVRGSGMPARLNLDYLLAPGTAHGVRTTRHPSLLSSVSLAWMATALRQQGVATFALQEFCAHGCVDTLLEPTPPPLDDAEVDHLQKLFPTFVLRRAG